MGFRLWINNDICLGKLYGYDQDFHMLSIDYLLSIGFFDEDIEDDYMWCDSDYEKVNTMFYCCTYIEYEMEYDTFMIFFGYYIADLMQKFILKGNKATVIELQKDLNFTIPDGKPVKLEWY